MKIGVNETERKELIEQIGDLEEAHCHNCELVKTFNFNFVASCCFKQCDIGKQLKGLGDKLSEGRQVNTGITLTRTRYLKLKLKDFDDKEVAKMYGLDYGKIRALRKKWGIKGNQLDYGLELINEKRHIKSAALLSEIHGI